MTWKAELPCPSMVAPGASGPVGDPPCRIFPDPQVGLADAEGCWRGDRLEQSFAISLGGHGLVLLPPPCPWLNPNPSLSSSRVYPSLHTCRRAGAPLPIPMGVVHRQGPSSQTIGKAGRCLTIFSFIFLLLFCSSKFCWHFSRGVCGMRNGHDFTACVWYLSCDT